MLAFAGFRAPIELHVPSSLLTEVSAPEIGFDCNLLKIVLMILVLEYVHIARRSRF
jgi:hypothetical protein